ncbi:MAG: hypothetical protein KAT65_06775 [Methanophagales archaeon]|nr:hypothetical protein [Methanophagales archaeon]
MKRELREDAIVDFFKKELGNMEFIDPKNHLYIESLLDSLCDHTKERYEKALTANAIWKFFIEKSLRAFTDNLRGYDELCRYFDDYIEYENLLFALDKNYRDHTIHSVWVMLLGFYLKENCAVFENINYVIGNLQKDDDNLQKTIEIIKKFENPLWCLIALTHDLGYPIEKTRKANAIMAKMITNFGFLRQNDFDYNFTIVHQTAINELLNIISSAVTWKPEGGYQVGRRVGTRVDMAKSFERLDHGIMSAYLLQMYIDWICGTMDIWQGLGNISSTSHETAAEKTMVITLLGAISAHTNRYSYSHRLNNMDSLLFISDELEEFSRYSRSLETSNWINVNCRTEVQWTKNSFGMNYIFDNRDIGDDIESFFEEKVRKIQNRFELNPKRITKLSITCSDVRKAKPVDFKYEKTLSGTIVKTPEKSFTNILDYFMEKPDLLP